MATHRERIYQQFLRTPEADHDNFCADVFQKYLDAMMKGIETPDDYLDHGLKSLELAVRVDAGREDLWKTFVRELSVIVAKVSKEARKRKKAQKGNKKKKS